MKTDFLFALRSLRRAPGFFFLAVATLGLGIAAVTAIFSLYYQVLLRSLPVRQPEQLVVFHSDPPNLPGNTSSDNNETVFSYAMYLRMRESGSLQGLVARSSAPLQMMVDGVAERAREEVVSGNFFDVLGVRASVGRLLTASDDTVRGGNPVAVVSYDFWVRRFGGSRAILNRTILLNGLPFTVVGVTADGFRGVLAGDSPEVYVPISMRAALTPGWNGFDRPEVQWLTLIGRLRPGVSWEAARTQLQSRFTAAMRDHVQQMNIHNQTSRARLEAKQLELRAASQGLNELEKKWKKPLFVLLAMVLLLLVISCANLANLLMARALNRTREMAIRLALGAGRLRIVRLLLTESALLAVLGTLCGLLLSPLLIRGVIRLMPARVLDGWLSGELNLPILAFSILLMLLATLLFGLAPAVQATRGESSPLGERSQTSGGGIHSRSRKVLVAGQIALSVVLLATAGLFSRSLVNLMRFQPGFRVDHLLSFSVDAGLGGYNTERGMNLYRELNKRLAALPGVTSVSMAFTAPLSGSESSSNVTVEGYTARDDENTDCDHNGVGAGYFRTLGTALLAGREFDDRDVRGATKVAIVNQAFVKRFFGNRDPMGRKMEIGAGGKVDIEIVGVVQDADNLSLREKVNPTFYIPYEQWIQPGPQIVRGSFVLRANSGLDTLAGAIRRTMANLDATLPVYALKPMRVNIEESIYTDRLIAALSTAFGVLALVLTAVGLYGVIAYLVSRRTAEIGIRMVLGAKPGSILGMILGEVGLLVAAGGAAGIGGAIAAGRAVESQLFGMHGLDPLVLTGAGVVLAVVALSAAAVPAVRAARIQPLEALRHE